MLHALAAVPQRGHQPPPEDAPEDAALVTVARADPQAFAPLYTRYGRLVYRYCCLRLESHEAAEDATSEIFLKALAGLPLCRAETFAAWLFQIAHNVVQDAHRRRRPTALVEALTDAPDPDPTPEDTAVGQAGWETLRSALASLPESQRRAVELQVAGWSVAQSASVLGTSPGTVKVLRHRALRRLRALLPRSPQEATGGE